MEQATSKIIIFTASVYKVQTLVDGGIRITLDLPETEVMQMAQLAECQRFGVALQVECQPLINSRIQQDAISTGSKRKSKWTTAKE